MATPVTEDFSPVFVGDTGSILSAQFLDNENNPIPRAGATIGMKMQNGATLNVCAGSWTIDDATNGLAHYAYQSADVSTPGTWMLYVTVTVGGKPRHMDPRQLVILSAP